MRGHDDILGQLLQPGRMIGQHIECVSIDHQRTLCTTQLGNHGDGRLLTGSQSRTNAHSVEILGINSL